MYVLCLLLVALWYSIVPVNYYFWWYFFGRLFLSFIPKKNVVLCGFVLFPRTQGYLRSGIEKENNLTTLHLLTLFYARLYTQRLFREDEHFIFFIFRAKLEKVWENVPKFGSLFPEPTLFGCRSLRRANQEKKKRIFIGTLNLILPVLAWIILLLTARIPFFLFKLMSSSVDWRWVKCWEPPREGRK